MDLTPRSNIVKYSTRSLEGENESQIELPDLKTKSRPRSAAANAWKYDNPAVRQMCGRPRVLSRKSTFPRGHWQLHGRGLTIIKPSTLPAIHKPPPPPVAPWVEGVALLERSKTEVISRPDSSGKKVRFSRENTVLTLDTNGIRQEPQANPMPVPLFSGSPEADRAAAPPPPVPQATTNQPTCTTSPTFNTTPQPANTTQKLPTEDDDDNLDGEPGLDGEGHDGESVASGKEPDAKTAVSDEEDERMMLILRGDFADLPPVKTNVIRIFLSSTFSDMKEERTVLFREAFPDIQEMCKSLGLEFQVVDMRWGVSEHTVSDHGVSAVCQQQIALCQRISAGPNFVVMFGDRYGFQPLPTCINEEEMKMILEICETCEVPNADLIQDWYLLDENSEPPVYELLAVGKKIPDYLNRSDAEVQKNGRKLWDHTSDCLQGALQTAARKAGKKDKMGKDTVEKYFRSVTEEEVYAGIIDDPAPNCLTFARELTNVQSYDDPMSAKFFDVTYKEEKLTFDPDKRERLESLRKRTESKSGVDRYYEAEWMGTGLAPAESVKNKEYLDAFCGDFKQLMKTRILKSMPSVGARTKQAFHDEALHHARFSVSRRSRFQGQKAIIEKVKTYLSDAERCRRPLVLHGPSGCGKTSVMSVLVDLVKEWLPGGDTVTMIRFLGTSPGSSDVRATLLSLVHQMCHVFGVTPPLKHQVETQTKLNKYLQQLLNDVNDLLIGGDDSGTDISGTSKDVGYKRLVLLFDSLDQLNFTDTAGVFQWLPLSCPTNIHIITSIASNLGTTVFADLKKRFRNEDQFIEIKPLSAEDINLILLQNLARNGRKIVPAEQMEILVNAAQQCGWPVYLNLLSNEASKWKSYDVIDPLSVEPTVHSAINKIFQDLEVKYDRLFVRTSLGYLTASGGISEVELEDLLSLNDEVLDNVYEFHNPPLEGVIRVPPLLWARVRHELEEYLVEREADGATVLSWYHRQFWETAEKRYLWPERDVSRYNQYNQDLAELFMVEKPVRRTIHLKKRNYTIENADRLVTLQPLTAANRRKLIKLPQFLARCDREKLISAVLCNPRWLITKMAGVSFQAALDDFTLTKVRDPEVKMTLGILKLAAPVLEKDPSRLPLEIISRLPTAGSMPNSRHLTALVAGAAQMFDLEAGAKIRPLFPCLPVPDGHLVATNKGPTHVVSMLGDTCAVTWGADAGLQVWNAASHRVLYQLGEPLALDDIHTTRDGSVVYHTSGTVLVGWSVLSGEMCFSLNVLPLEDAAETGLVTVMAVSGDGRFVAVRVNHKDVLVDGGGLVIVDVKAEKITCSTAADVCGHKIPAVQFLDDDVLFYASVQQSGKGKLTTLVKFNVQTKDTSETILDKKLTIKANAENYMTSSTTLRPDRGELVITCRPDDIVVVAIDQWTISCPTMVTDEGDVTTLPKPDVTETSPKIRFMTSTSVQAPVTTDKIPLTRKFNQITYTPTYDGQSMTVSYVPARRTTLFRLFDENYQHVHDMQKVASMKSSADKPTVVHVAPAARLAFVGYTVSGVVDIWDLEARCLRHTLNAHVQPVTNIYFNADTRVLYTSSSDQTVKVWDTSVFLGSFFRQQKMAADKTDEETVTKETTSADEKPVAVDTEEATPGGTSQTDDNLSDVSDTEEVETEHSLSEELTRHSVEQKGRTTGIIDLQLTRTGVYTCYDKTAPTAWNQTTGVPLHPKLDSGKQIGRHKKPSTDGILRVKQGAEENTLICCTVMEPLTDADTFCVKKWDVSTGMLEDFGKTPLIARILGVSKNGRYMGVLVKEVDPGEEAKTQPNTVCVYDTTTKEIEWKCPVNKCDFIAVTDDGKFVFIIAHRNTLQAFECQTREAGRTEVVKHKLPSLSTTEDAIAFLKDRQVIIGTTYGKIVKLDINNLQSDPETSEVNWMRKLPIEHKNEVRHLITCPQEKLMLSSSNTVKIMDLETETLTHELIGHTDRVWLTSISADSRYVISASRDETLRVWDLKREGHQVACFHAYTDVYNVMFCAEDSRTIFALSGRYGNRKLLRLRFIEDLESTKEA